MIRSLHRSLFRPLHRSLGVRPENDFTATTAQTSTVDAGARTPEFNAGDSEPALQNAAAVSGPPPPAPPPPVRRVRAKDSDAMRWQRRDLLPPTYTHKRGFDVIMDPQLNKGTGFPDGEIDRMGIRGLVPPRQFTIEEQERRIMHRFNRIDTDFGKYLYLSALQDRNETLFYHVLMNNIKQMAPIIYTPTVGTACQEYGTHFRRTRGMFFTPKDRGHIAAMLSNWPDDTDDGVDLVVVTDGSRILGLGDLGAHGMPIPVGKLALYTAAAGISPTRVLPALIDVGTDNVELRESDQYMGVQKPRLRGPAYFSMIEEFLFAVNEKWPGVLVQFEDFQTSTALPVLQKYRSRYLTFNDDIQGTGAVTLAGVLSGLRAQGLPAGALCDQRIVVAGAGSAGVGVAKSILQAMVQMGMSRQDALDRFWMVDVKGLLTDGRHRDMSYAQLPFARSDTDKTMSLEETVLEVKPSILLGLSGACGTFTQPMVHTMAETHRSPMVFPLSNPTANAECTAEQAYRWSGGRAIVASGSPFDPVQYEGKTLVPSQGNNMYIFPGLGLGAIASRATQITDEMIYTSALALAESVSPEDQARGAVYPDLSSIREVSKTIATRVAEVAFSSGMATVPRPRSVSKHVESLMWTPQYSPMVYAHTSDTQKRPWWQNVTAGNY